MKIPGMEYLPMDQLDETRRKLREQGVKFRVYFRGPRYGRFSQDTYKEDAVAFTVYAVEGSSAYRPGHL